MPSTYYSGVWNISQPLALWIVLLGTLNFPTLKQTSMENGVKSEGERAVWREKGPAHLGVGRDEQIHLVG